jgi:hypothetical protein
MPLIVPQSRYRDQETNFGIGGRFLRDCLLPLAGKRRCAPAINSGKPKAALQNGAYKL